METADPGETVPSRVIVHPSGTPAFVVVPGSLGGDPDAPYTREMWGGVTGLDIDPSTGTLPLDKPYFPSPGDLPGAWNAAIDPTGRFLYVVSHGCDNYDCPDSLGTWPGRLRSYEIDLRGGAIRQIQEILVEPWEESIDVHPAGGSLYLAGDEVKVYAIDPSSGTLAEVQELETARRVAIDPAGRFAYLGHRDRVGVYAIDSPTGTLSESTRHSSLWEDSYKRIAFLAQHEYNEDPIVYAGPDRFHPFGTSVALHGHNSFDPDAGACSADPNSYVIAWTLVSAPPASSLSTADIVNAGSLRNAGFVPDARGDYTLRLSFTDDAGTCSDLPKTTEASVTISACDYQTLHDKYLNTVGPAPFVGAEWHVQQVRTVEYGVLKRWVVVWDAKFLFVFVYRYLKTSSKPPCTSDVTTPEDARRQCDDVVPGWLAYDVWEHRYFETHIEGFWSGWNCTP
jgi:hypothetical protein